MRLQQQFSTAEVNSQGAGSCSAARALPFLLLLFVLLLHTPHTPLLAGTHQMALSQMTDAAG